VPVQATIGSSESQLGTRARPVSRLLRSGALVDTMTSFAPGSIQGHQISDSATPVPLDAT
jgi:hypothetical protein